MRTALQEKENGGSNVRERNRLLYKHKELHPELQQNIGTTG
jgi:hypothetical protein